MTSLLTLAALPAVLVAAGADTAMMEELSRQRHQLEGLAMRVEERQAEVHDAHAARLRRTQEMAGELAELKLRQRLLLQQEREGQALDEQQKQANMEMQPRLFAVLEQLAGHIRGGLPFRTPERLAEVVALEDGLRSGRMTATAVLSRIWALLEDEARLARETGLYTHPVELDGTVTLSEVVRIGMGLMFFQAQDGRVGYAKQQQELWTMVVEKDPVQQDRIRQLFVSFRRQVRTGVFQVPNPMSAVGAP